MTFRFNFIESGGRVYILAEDVLNMVELSRDYKLDETVKTIAEQAIATKEEWDKRHK